MTGLRLKLRPGERVLINGAVIENGRAQVELRVLPGRTHYQMAAYVPALRVAGDWMLERWRAR